ncbi:MAG TPA: hypothetical protein VMY88_12525 [Acidimicrobiales bacterium]|nr:hypothetical protein [Acidimicrobiales bacterium]
MSGTEEPKLGDELPEDLVPSAVRGKYSVPDNARRKRPALVFAVAAALSAALWFTRGEGGVLVNSGFVAAAVGFALLAGYFAASARGVRVWEDGAIATAKQITDLPAGTGRAQLAWRGLLGRPVWRVLIHDESGAQARRGVVIVDAADGSVVEHLKETVAPE